MSSGKAPRQFGADQTPIAIPLEKRKKAWPPITTRLQKQHTFLHPHLASNSTVRLASTPPRTPLSRKDCAPVPLDIRISLFRKKLHGSDGSAFFFQMLSFYILETELAKRSMDASAKPPPHSLYLATSFSSRQRRETCSTTAAPTGGAEWGTPPPYS